jgi:hypothetical protein
MEAFSMLTEFNIQKFGAIGDGNSHPLSGFYGSLVTAQVDYPEAMSLTNEIDWAATQKAITAAAGQTVYAPAGTYLINVQLSYVTTSSLVKVGGLRLVGDGRHQTILDTRVESAAMLKVDTDTSRKFQEGGLLQGFTIKRTQSKMATSGISLRRAYHFKIEDVLIDYMSADGLIFVINEGDGDGSLMTWLQRVWINGAQGWGINVNASAGVNELSFTMLDDVVIQSCGTASESTPPPSGGMKWKGQHLVVRNSSFTTCENIAFYVPGGAGAPTALTMDNVNFENNIRRNIYIGTLISGNFRNTQFHQNDSFLATTGFELVPASGVIDNVRIDGTIMRVSAGNNPFTAFSIGASTRWTRITGTDWQSFDGPGQVRFSDQGDNTVIQDQRDEYPPLDALMARVLSNATFTVDTASDVITTSAAHGLTDSDVVQFTSSGTLPAGLSQATDYSVVTKSTTQFKVRPVLGGLMRSVGHDIDITSTGSGTHSLSSTYTPNASRYAIHRIKVLVAGVTYTIANPTIMGSGASNNSRRILFDIINGPGGAATISFGTAYSLTSFSYPTGAGARTNVELYYNNFDAPAWNQIGKWR